jgi:predicted RNA-binding protein with PUA-like domain
MAYWLVKSEPETWSWDEQVKKGEKGTAWDGVRNFQAAANLKAMKVGDQAFFYHSGEERAVVGIVKVTRTAYPDPSDETGRFVMVDVKAHKPLPKPVTLAAIKAEPRLKDIKLVRQGRLSVSPLAPEEFALICRMGGLAKPD